MGHIILPTGYTVWAEELSGSVKLDQLINDIGCDAYTDSYRISCLVSVLKNVKLTDDVSKALVPVVHRLGEKGGTLAVITKDMLAKLSPNFVLES